jgi:hypothetical protein
VDHIAGILNKSVLLLIILLIFSCGAHAQKNDTIYLKNGDRVTGELKRYKNGILELSTEGMSKLSIEYDKINTIHSSKYFEIVTTTGFSYFGSICRSKETATIGVVITNDTVPEKMKDIVELTQIGKRFWNKFYGTVELGLSFYKSTQVLQYYFNSEINYRARKDLVTFGLDLSRSDQKINDSTAVSRNNEVSLGLSHFFPGKFWGGLEGKLQQNSELDLDYRYQLGVGAGYDIVHTNPIRFYALAGALVNREKPTDSISASTNYEGLVSIKFTWLQHKHPKVDISTNCNFYPSFSIAGRYRLEYNLSVKYEIFSDLFIGLTYYNDFDSKPSGGGPALNDWSVIFSVGYSF